MFRRIRHGRAPGSLIFLCLLVSPCAVSAAPEQCLTCHPARPADAHQALDCVQCHGGDPLATTEAAAHRGLEAEPGALDTLGLTCGQGACHPVEGARVRSSAMATAVGLVNASRRSFGEGPAARTVDALWADPSPSPADDYTRRLCTGCHLGVRRDNRDDAIERAGSGCSACHLSPATGHPVTVAQPEDASCAGCHSRSGRVALGYAGWAERTDGVCDSPLPWPDGRTLCAAPADDVHHAAGLDCVDCHTHRELMGDGRVPQGLADAVETTCEGCHAAEQAAAPVTQADDPFLVDRLARKGVPLDGPLRRGTRGTPLWNLRPQGAGWVLYRKADGAPFPVPLVPEDADHQQPGHARLTCQACHTPWIPTCASCHVTSDPAGEQWDFGPGAVRPGRWVETGRDFTVASPALAVNAAGRIAPAAPGMIHTVDASPAGGGRHSARWFAPFDPHTTRREARTCTDCHGGAVALGLGQGTLQATAAGWRFQPRHPDPVAPGRAQDGWISLQQVQPGQGPRPGIRSLDRAERDRVLTVARCLACHRLGTDPIYVNFAESLRTQSEPGTRCAAPR